MVVVPAGTFLMGAPPFEGGLVADAGPPHHVTLRSFAIGRSHVTRGQFAAFVRATGYPSTGLCYTWQMHRTPELRLETERTWQTPGFEQADEDPVVCVSWDDAQQYARWLSARTGHPYRLPSEAEWEYAARAGTTTPRFWDDAPEGTCAYAQTANLTFAEAMNGSRAPDNIAVCRTGHIYTAPAASFQPNRFGLYDMLGNAWQFVEDCYHEGYGDAPPDGSAWTGGPCDRRVLRGGSWNNPPQVIRADLRTRSFNGCRYTNVGFRVARSLTPGP